MCDVYLDIFVILQIKLEFCICTFDVSCYDISFQMKYFLLKMDSIKI